MYVQLCLFRLYKGRSLGIPIILDLTLLEATHHAIVVEMHQAVVLG